MHAASRSSRVCLISTAIRTISTLVEFGEQFGRSHGGLLQGCHRCPPLALCGPRDYRLFSRSEGLGVLSIKYYPLCGHIDMERLTA